MSSFAIVKENGSICRLLGNVMPTHIEEGQRLSYQERVLAMLPKEAKLMHIEIPGAEGFAKLIFHDGRYGTEIHVVGTSVEAVKDVIMRLREECGLVYINRSFLKLPELGSIRERIKFLWNYILRGEVPA